MSNEEQNQLPEIAQNQIIVKETAEYVTILEDGKYKRKAKFSDYSSVSAETRDEKIWLMNLIEGDEESGSGLKEHVGKLIQVQDVITRTYTKVNEDTGIEEFGVLTYLITPERQAFVTSSKTVYFNITRIMDLFETPDKWEQPIQVKVLKEKRENGDMIKIKMVG